MQMALQILNEMLPDVESQNEQKQSKDADQDDIKLPVIDWSTRQKTQEWFNSVAAGFNPAVQKNLKYKEMCARYADDIIDINWWGAFYGKPELIKDLENNLSTSILKSWNAYFDLDVWSKDQSIVQMAYHYVGINGEENRFSGKLLVRPTKDKKQISLWIYTADQAVIDETCAFFQRLNKYKSEL
eukprot:UN00542